MIYMKQVIIDPRMKYNYASWYLLGIKRLLKEWKVLYDVRPFKAIKYENTADYNSGIAFIVRDDIQDKKVFIDTEDVAKIFIDRYEWCDVYGMVNPTKEQVKQYEKLVAIGPEFGITLENSLLTVFRCLKNFAKGYKFTHISFKDYLRDYLYTNIRRRSLLYMSLRQKSVPIIYFMLPRYGIMNLPQQILICTVENS